MGEYKIYTCDLCGKEQQEPNYVNIVINQFFRERYHNNDEEHYCCDFDLCYECANKYRLTHYKRVDDGIKFVTENYSFLDRIKKLVTGRKKDRIS